MCVYSARDYTFKDQLEQCIIKQGKPNLVHIQANRKKLIDKVVRLHQ